MAIQPNDEVSSEREPGNEIHKETIGRVQYRIYRNVNLRTGVYYRIKFFRTEKNADGSKEWLAKSFFHEDLVNVAKAATASLIWLSDNTDYVPGPVETVFPKFNPVRGPDKKEPVHEFQVGNVLASIWENTSPRTGKLYYKSSFRRGELTGGQEMVWNNFRPEDTSHLAQATTICRKWLADRRGELLRNDVKKEQGEEKRPAEASASRAADEA
jgi:hypothetical protein